ncbi:hypothetical protein [Candidatus Sneabacter namystus]|uniref:Uncharacterized protein n=1 Tax=Candidatus Sneabacter namystus TaxID=2601646 RepID=A0A5C0UIL5_9RICK|nr:hypothetical protein [Candidatus Sneabacter namystus]QEK39627.1 hypothetical protein FZC37_01610 [Candidatus Sneabacter namystus]
MNLYIRKCKDDSSKEKKKFVFFTCLSTALHLIVLCLIASVKGADVPIFHDNVVEILSYTEQVSKKGSRVASAVGKATDKPGITKDIKPGKKVVSDTKDKTWNVKKEDIAKKEDNKKVSSAKKIILKNTRQNASVVEEGNVFDVPEYDIEDADSLAEIDYIKSKVELHRSCVGLFAKGIEEVEMVFEIGLNKNGSVNYVKYIADNATGLITEKTKNTLYNQNLRAITLSAPFDKLDPANFDRWKCVRMKFTHKS